MKILPFLLMAASMPVCATGWGQNVSLRAEQAHPREVIKHLEKQTGYRFIYGSHLMEGTKPITIQANNQPLEKVLQQCFKEQAFDFEIDPPFVILKSAKRQKVINSRNEPISNGVKGVVVSLDDEPIPGVSVSVKGTNIVSVTDSKGQFELQGLPENAVLVFSGAEFQIREISVGNRTELFVRMERKESILEETVVMAYGKTTRKLATGNIIKVSGKTISQQPVLNPILGLQGRVPGLIINQGSGYSAGAVTIQLRGQNSLLQGSEPLFIVDGIPSASQNNPLNELNNASSTNNDWSPGGISPLHLLNADDIESVEVLKDADATAIYGSRGANGVILITTRKGKAGRLQVSGEASFSSSKVTDLVEMMNTRQYVAMRQEAFANDGINPTINNAPDLFIWDTTRYTNFPKYFLGGRALTHQASIGLQGGSDQVQFRFGGSYLTESTVLPTEFRNEKISAHTSISYKSNDSKWLSQTSIGLVSSKNELPSFDVAAFIHTAPHLRIFNNGKLNWQEGGVPYNDLGLGPQSNPMSYLESRYTGNFQNLNASTTLEYAVHKAIKFRLQGGFNQTFSDEKRLNPSTSIDPYGSNPLPSAFFANTKMQTWIFEPQVEYDWKNKWGKMSVLIGATWQSLKRKSDNISANNYSSDLLLNSPAGAGLVSIGNSYGDYRYIAIFGRLQFNRQDKYLLSLTGRRDGSSRFGPDNQFSSFGAVGTAWVFSSEKFFTKLLPIVSFGKLRASFGITGSDQIGDYQFLDSWSATTVSYLGNVGLQQMALYNPDLAWETNRKLELGLQLAFANNRFDLEISGFRNRSGNQLVNYSLPVQTGFTSIIRNLDAKVENKGLEIVLGGNISNSATFRWRSEINLTTQANKLLSFPGLEQSSYANQFVIGQPISVERLYEYTGIGTNGFYTFRDIDQSGNYNFADRILLENTNPSWFGGFNNEFRFKNLEISLFFQLVKQSGWNYLKTLGGLAPGTAFKNQPTYALERWRAIGDQTSVQRFTTITSGTANTISYLLGSDAALSDASFIRLKNISASYPFTFRKGQGVGFNVLNVFLHAQNLLTISRYKGADPENQSILRMPPLKTFRIGVRVKL